ncbi:RNA polymerase sigma factor [Desertivirga xinjiangensis]|uniref:RNA polymerase sigma factor n=1 Tax=Desertivirga xinjiangensis TaxID=539206 RepID=UPI00210EA2CD|nr:sigma-70 family RNA polymerase sigma factor [Pedobacter xinjiangensis]
MLKNEARAQEDLLIAYEQYWEMLFDIAFFKTGDTEVAKDIVQDVFIGLWNNISSIRLDEIKFYLLRSLRNRVINYYRNAGVRHKHMDLYLQTLSEAEEQTFGNLTAKELQKLIDTEIRLLPEKMGEIVRLSCIEDYSHTEIADMLSLSTQTVKNQLSSGRKRLKDALSQYPLDYHLPILTFFLNL